MINIPLQPMETAPKDGTKILIRFEHENFKYASDENKDDWWELCEAKWIDHNGGGWTWHGICGAATGWIAKPKSYDNATPHADAVRVLDNDTMNLLMEYTRNSKADVERFIGAAKACGYELVRVSNPAVVAATEWK